MRLLSVCRIGEALSLSANTTIPTGPRTARDESTVNRQILIAGIVVVLLVAAGVLLLIPSPTTPDDGEETGDTTPPVITQVYPENDTTVFGAVPLSFTAHDNSSIPRYEIMIDGVLVAVGQSYNWNTRGEEDGSHTITYRARDSSANWGSASVLLTVNNTLPEYEFTGKFKIMTYNIEESGINKDWKEVVKEENPDILMLVETGYMEDNGNRMLRSALDEFNAYFSDELPYVGLAAQNIAFSTSGEAIMSRYPVLAFKQIPRVTLDDATVYDVTHDFIDAVIDINGTEVHFIGNHLKAGGGDDNQQRRNYENEGIINYMDALGEVPIVYLGDMNSYSPQDNVTNDSNLGYGPMTMLVEPDDPVYGEYSSQVHNFTDVYRALNPNETGYTYGHQYEPFLGRIDYIIVNSFFTDKLINSTVGDTAHAYSGSDHYCVDAWISWDGTDAVNLTAPSASTGIVMDLTRPREVNPSSDHDSLSSGTFGLMEHASALLRDYGRPVIVATIISPVKH